MKGPSRKDESLPKSGSLHTYNKDFSKIKSKTNLPTTYDEAKASCKARKRKERQESISSLCQERKVIRSNSEERPAQKKHFENKSVMRRVCSNEDFQKQEGKVVNIAQLNEKSSISPHRQISNEILIFDEDCENEKRRSHERFSKPLLFKNKKTYKNKKPKVRCLPKPKFKPETYKEESREIQAENVDDTKLEALLQLHVEVKDRSPSPVHQFSPDLDLSTLHEQIDCSEPLLSCANHEINEDTETLPGLSVASNRLLSSPRNSIIATHRIYLDPDVQATFNLEGKIENPLEVRLQKVTKHINSLKKKIKKSEGEFEATHGYKVSHADKLNDKNMRKLYMELNKMKKEQKQIVEVCPGSPGEVVLEQPKSIRNLQDTLNEIEKRLVQKRETAKRTSISEQMSPEELLDEKVAVQKALLYLESVHGRPDNKMDRNLVRPIYDRYRNLKRLLSKGQSNLLGNELATIHEDETMTFVPSVTPQTSEVDSEKSSMLTGTESSSDPDTSISENLHSLTKVELLQQHRLVCEEKKELRRAIKTFEMEFRQKAGRMVQKEDKLLIEHVYVSYKKVKAKLKLLDALVGKQL